MCRNAEYMTEWYHLPARYTNCFFFDSCPQSFHPSSGDKLIFLGIIDKWLDNIMSEDRTLTNENIAGISLLGNCYYPFWR